MPARRGLILLASGMALVIAGRFLALSELTTVGFMLAALVLVMVVALWVQVLRARFVRLTVERVHPAANVFANRPFPVKLQARATHSRLPYATIVERVGGNDGRGSTDGSELGGRSLSAGLCRVGDLSYERTLPRGLHQLGPGRITLVDSLGLTRLPFVRIPTTTVHVWPETRHLDAEVVGRLFELSTTNAESEPGDLREYVLGDDLRHVHWPTSARIDRLMMRDRENARRAESTNLVIADISAPTNARDFELVLSVAASLLYSVDLQDQVELVLVGPSGHSRHQGLERAMAALCRAVPDRESGADRRMELTMLHTGIVVATDETMVPENARGPVLRCSRRSIPEIDESTYTVFRVHSLNDLEDELDLVMRPPRRSG